MMMMSGGITSCCVALLLTLTSVSAVKRALNSIHDLKSIDFGETVPKRSLLLLHWFANEIYIDEDGVMYLTFDANSGEYGSHYYGPYRSVLDPPPPGHQYYTLGNIHEDGSQDLPDHVVQFDDDENRGRIIFRVREQNVGQIIDQVYITQHYEPSEHQGTAYDPEHTYQVTTSLLRAIRKFSFEGNNINTLTSLRDHFRSSVDDSQLRETINTWGDLACLGLFLLIVIQETYPPPQHNNGRQAAAGRNTQRDPMVIAPQSRKNAASDDIILKVTTDKSGKAKIIWRNVPKDFLNQGVMVALYKNNQDKKALTSKSIDRESGSYGTSVPLIEGFQVRLHEEKKLFFFWKWIGEEKYRGSEFKNPEVSITGYDASLQLFVKDGKACARLRVKKSFRNWRSEFKNSWVGFYSSGDKATNSYAWWQWQWATKFKERIDFQNSTHDEYEYESGMAIAPGVQIRFILRDEIERARTPALE